MKILIPSQLAIDYTEPVYSLQLSKHNGTFSPKKKKILLPFKSDNLHLLAYAINLAKVINGEIIVLADLNINKEQLEGITVEEELKRSWYKKFWEFYSLKNQYISTFNEGKSKLMIKFIYEFRNVNLLEGIVEIGKKYPVEYIVLSHSDFVNDDIKQMLLETKTPVLIVPDGYQSNIPKNIAYATDFHKFSNSDRVANQVLDLAKLLNASVHFLHLTEKSHTIEVEDVDFFNQLLKVTHKNNQHTMEIVKGSDSLVALQEYVVNSNIDLIVVIQQHRNWLHDLFHESFSEKVNDLNNKPLLLYKD